MTKFTQKFSLILKSQWQSVFAYPGMLLIWMFDTFFAPLVMLVIWKMIILSGNGLKDQEEVITSYYIILPLISLVVSAWHSTFLAQSIRDGKLNTLLIKPINPIVFDTTNNIAEKVLKMFFLLPMVIVGALIFNAQLHSTGIRAVLFILSLVLAAIFRFITEHLIGILGFWIEEVVSIKNLIDASSLAFGGWIVPLFLFSTQLQEILKWLPFYYYGGFSLEILVSPMPYINIYIGILFQIGWTLLISMLTIFLWKKGVKKYSAYGG